MKEKKEEKLVKKYRLVGEWKHVTGTPSGRDFRNEESAKYYANKLGLTYIIVYAEPSVFDDLILY